MLTPLTRRAAPAAKVGALVVTLGVMHLSLDGLTGILVPLQPTLSASTGASPTALGLLVALALASASMLQPLTASLAIRWGDGRAAVAGGLLAALGYGVLPATDTTFQAAAAVVVGGLGSALFHPGAGALVARAAPPGGEALPLAMFSAVGTGGAALVPLAVLSGVDTLGAAAAVPFAVALAAVATGTLFARAARAAPPRRPVTATDQPRILHAPVTVFLPVLVAALISLTGVTANATAPLLLAETVGPTDPLLGYTVTAYSAAGALGGIALALAVRRTRLTTVMRTAVGIGTLAALALPHVPPFVAPAVMLAVGLGLSGTLPLLVTLAKRPDEASAAAAVARILGLATGLGGLGYAGVGALQAATGYTPALSITAAAAGGSALVLIGRLRHRGTHSHDALNTALTACGCAGAASPAAAALSGTTQGHRPESHP